VIRRSVSRSVERFGLDAKCLVSWFHYGKPSDGELQQQIATIDMDILVGEQCAPSSTYTYSPGTWCAQTSKLRHTPHEGLTAYKTVVSFILISLELPGVPMYPALFWEWAKPMVTVKLRPYFVSSKPNYSSIVTVMLNAFDRFLSQASLEYPDVSSKSTDRWNHVQRTPH